MLEKRGTGMVYGPKDRVGLCDLDTPGIKKKSLCIQSHLTSTVLERSLFDFVGLKSCHKQLPCEP